MNREDKQRCLSLQNWFIWAQVVKEAMEESGCVFHLGTNLKMIEYASDEPDENGDRVIRITFEQNGEEQVVEVDRLMVATGRKPNVEGIGLEEVT